VVVGKILLHSFRRLVEYGIDCYVIVIGREIRKIGETLCQGFQGFSQGLDLGRVEHHQNIVGG
jgi:hypothetical protein